MALRSPASVKPERPARIRVPNRERVLFTIRDHRFVEVLQRLSLTGGSVIHTEAPLPRGTLASLDLKTVFGKVKSWQFANLSATRVVAGTTSVYHQ